MQSTYIMCEELSDIWPQDLAYENEHEVNLDRT